jgi:chromosome segregation ATPase
LRKAHIRLQQRLDQQETASESANSKIEELQGDLRAAKDTLKRETDKVVKAEKMIADLREKNKDLQKELDDLVKEDDGRNGVVSSHQSEIPQETDSRESS